LQGLQPLGVAANAFHLTLAGPDGKVATQVTLFDQGQVQFLQAAATGLSPKQQYVLALAAHPDGSGPLQALTGFTTNPAGAAIVNTVGPIRQVVQNKGAETQRYLVITSGTPDKPGSVVQTPLQ
jgi:hypothetical protein